MPRAAVRRKASTNNNNAGENGGDGDKEIQPPKVKRSRFQFSLTVPERRSVVGTVLVCGSGEMGQLGLGESISERKRLALLESVPNVVDVCAGGMHCLVLTKDGKVYSFGCNDEGALGRDSSEEGAEFTPMHVDLPGKGARISAGDSHSACLLEDGRVYAWGSFRDSHGNMGLTIDGNKRLPIDVLPGTTCCAIASGADHLVILTTGGKVFTVGCGEQGQLGRISQRSISGEGRRGKKDLLEPGQVTLKRNKPFDAIWATNYCTFMRETQTGHVYAVGLNNYKQLVYNKNQETLINPILTSLQDVKEIAGGQHHTLVLKTDNKCYSIGRSDYGRLGLGDCKDIVSLTAVPKLRGKRIVQIACGEVVSYAITDDGKLYSWGMGSNNQLGVGDGDDELEPVEVQSKNTQNRQMISASGGGQHSIFLVKVDSAELMSKPLKQSNELKDQIAATKRDDAAAAVVPKKKKLAQQIQKENDEENTDRAIEINSNTDVVIVESETSGTSGTSSTSIVTSSTSLSSDSATTVNKLAAKRGRKKK